MAENLEPNRDLNPTDTINPVTHIQTNPASLAQSIPPVTTPTEIQTSEQPKSADASANS